MDHSSCLRKFENDTEAKTGMQLYTELYFLDFIIIVDVSFNDKIDHFLSK